MTISARRAPEIIAVLAALTFAAMYFYTALPRLVYPYDLDFVEDSIFMQSLRVARGQPVYVPPNADFDPHVYMPLYFWLGGWAIQLGGPSLGLLRLISFGATLVTTFLIYGIARRESGLGWIGIVCAGLFLGGYRINGFWYEIVRVDSLFVALTLGGLALSLYAGASNRRLILSAVVLALSFFTKQTGALIGLGLALYLFAALGRRALWFAITFGGLTLVPLFTLNAFTGGWFFYHVFRIGSADPVEVGRIVNYVVFELFGVMTVLSLMAIVAGWLGARRAGLKVILDQPWLFAIGMAVVISGIGRARVGGNLNNRMPAYALLCLAPAILIREWSALIPARGELWLRWRDRLMAATIIIQFALGGYYPPRYIPTAAMRQSGDRLIKRIASIDGRVLVMMHPYYALLAGKEPAAQIATIWYVRYRGALPLPDDFVNRIQSRYYAAIISDESLFETEPDIHGLLTTYYVPAETLDASEAPPTTTGVVVRPTVIYVPKQP